MIDLGRAREALAFGPDDALIPVTKSWMAEVAREIEDCRRERAGDMSVLRCARGDVDC